MVDERGGPGSRRKEEYALGVRLTVLVARENAASSQAAQSGFGAGREVARFQTGSVERIAGRYTGDKGTGPVARVSRASSTGQRVRRQ
jgi:hypothetical protein